MATSSRWFDWTGFLDTNEPEAQALDRLANRARQEGFAHTWGLPNNPDDDTNAVVVIPERSLKAWSRMIVQNYGSAGARRYRTPKQAIDDHRMRLRRYLLINRARIRDGNDELAAVPMPAVINGVNVVIEVIPVGTEQYEHALRQLGNPGPDATIDINAFRQVASTSRETLISGARARIGQVNDGLTFPAVTQEIARRAWEQVIGGSNSAEKQAFINRLGRDGIDTFETLVDRFHSALSASRSHAPPSQRPAVWEREQVRRLAFLVTDALEFPAGFDLAGLRIAMSEFPLPDRFSDRHRSSSAGMPVIGLTPSGWTPSQARLRELRQAQREMTLPHAREIHRRLMQDPGEYVENNVTELRRRLGHALVGADASYAISRHHISSGAAVDRFLALIIAAEEQANAAGIEHANFPLPQETRRVAVGFEEVLKSLVPGSAYLDREAWALLLYSLSNEALDSSGFDLYREYKSETNTWEFTPLAFAGIGDEQSEGDVEYLYEIYKSGALDRDEGFGWNP